MKGWKKGIEIEAKKFFESLRPAQNTSAVAKRREG
jgi:hypothetical protein